MTLHHYVFWPSEDSRVQGYLYGWAHPTITCVAGVLRTKSSHDAEEKLALFLKDNPYFSAGAAAAAPPVVLGRCDAGKGKVPTLELREGKRDDSSAVTIVLYRRSALGSLRFQILDGSSPETKRISIPPDSKIRVSSLGVSEDTLVELNSAHRLHSVLHMSESSLAKSSVLISLGRTTQKTVQSFAIRIRPLNAVLHFTFTVILGILAPFWQFIMLARSQSYFLQQIYTRARLIHDLSVYPRLSLVYSRLETSAQYVQFNNAIWLVLNDLVLGIAMGSFISDNHVVIGAMFHRFLEFVFINFTRDALLWLDDWPAGLKLNTELSHFCCRAFFGMLELWALTIRALAPYFSTVIFFLGLTGFVGLTTTLSLLLDMFRALTLHVSLSYYILTHLLSYQSSALSSLWNLFRGKRFNMLHNHVDSWHYEVDQLLLGTLLFTLVTFSLPTFLTYTLLFVVLRSAIVILSSLVNLLVDLMNRFPLFALLLRIKDPRRLPGSMHLRIVPATGSDPQHLFLEIETASFLTIFMQYGFSEKYRFSSAL